MTARDWVTFGACLLFILTPTLLLLSATFR